jgi:hypothetical protein
MLLPVPPDANNIRLTADNVELHWTWSSENYPTVPPEMPTIPMIEWQGPFPTGGAVIGIEETGLMTTLVADVHTHTAEGKVLEEAVGYVDLIIVACPSPDGSIFLAAGPVLSYYEFKHPMSDRLTDEAWQNLLDSPEKPERPTWFLPLMQ